jgi:hypothetical protein
MSNMIKHETKTIYGMNITHSIHKHTDGTLIHGYSILTSSDDTIKIKFMHYIEKTVNRLYNKYNSVNVKSYNDTMYHITCR